MTAIDSLKNEETEVLTESSKRPEYSSIWQHKKFTHSLRSRGYIFIGLVLTYMFLATVFFFSQRAQPLQQLQQYQKIQQTQQALKQADLAAFHVVTVLFSEVTQSELNRVVSYFSTLKPKYQQLRFLFPEQAEAFQNLEQSIPEPRQNPGEEYLQKVHIHLAESKNEIDRLMKANQARMTGLVQEYRQQDDYLVMKSLVLGSLGLAMIGTITTLFFNRLKTDLLSLQQRTAEIVKGYRGEPLILNRQDELGQLADGINFLSQALEEREKALEIERRETSFREKMTAVDSLAGGIAHEIGNPITCISGLANEFTNDPKSHLSEESKSTLLQLQQYSDGIIRVTQNLSMLGTQNSDRSEWIDINQLLLRIENLCHYDKRWSGITLTTDLDHDLPAVFASEIQFNQMMTQLLENALDALSDIDSPIIHLQTKNYLQHGVTIIVQDNGVGVEQDKLKMIFEPFYTTKPFGHGTGLGLAMCWTIVKSLNGNIVAETMPTGGLKIIIDIPGTDPSLDQV